MSSRPAICSVAGPVSLFQAPAVSFRYVTDDLHFRFATNMTCVESDAPVAVLLPSRVEPKFSSGFFDGPSFFIVRHDLLDVLDRNSDWE